MKSTSQKKQASPKVQGNAVGGHNTSLRAATKKKNIVASSSETIHSFGNTRKKGLGNDQDKKNVKSNMSERIQAHPSSPESNLTHCKENGLRKTNATKIHLQKSPQPYSILNNDIGSRINSTDTIHTDHFTSDKLVKTKVNQQVYRKYADNYDERFRAAIDYQYYEPPRQILGICCFLFFLICVAFLDGLYPIPLLRGSDKAVFDLNLQKCIFTLFVVTAGYSFLHTKDGLLVRPHPGVWRVIHGMCFFYFLILCALLTSNVKIGNKLVQSLLNISSLNTPASSVFTGTLELNCALNQETVLRQLKSFWFKCHVAGWIAKMCIYRDWVFCIIFSIAFEFFELSFQWMVPQLQECWWDSIILDVIFANTLGMIFGVLFLRFFKNYQFDWMGERPIYRMTLLKLVPFSWSPYNWSFFATPWRLCQTLILLFSSILTELNSFFLMYALNIHALHPFHVFRISLLVLLALSAVTEHYEYVNSRGKRIGHNAWLFAIIVLSEILLCIKYGAPHYISANPPSDILIPWITSAIIFSLWCINHFQMKTTLGKAEGKNCRGALYSIRKTMQITPPVICFIPLLYLFKNYHY